MEKIIVYRDFDDVPGPRFIHEGEHSGEEFRENVLLRGFRKALESKTTLVVDLDGTNGYGNSFLEEAFGGLVRKHGYSEEIVDKTIEIISFEEPHWIEKIRGYIKHAKNPDGRKEYKPSYA